MLRRSLLALCILAAAAVSGHAQEGGRPWGDYGGGPDSKANVNQLQVAWSYPTGDNRSSLFSPLIIDNIVYVQARNSSLCGAAYFLVLNR